MDNIPHSWVRKPQRERREYELFRNLRHLFASFSVALPCIGSMDDKYQADELRNYEKEYISTLGCCKN